MDNEVFGEMKIRKKLWGPSETSLVLLVIFGGKYRGGWWVYFGMIGG
jgi:hypothetical protein